MSNRFGLGQVSKTLEIPHGSTSGLLQPGTARNVTSTSYVDFPGTDLLKIDNFVKHRADTSLLVTISGSYYGSVASVLFFGVRVNSVDYDVGAVANTATSSQYPYSVTNIVAVPTAGTYTIQVRWKVTTGTYTVNEFSRQCLTAVEIAP